MRTIICATLAIILSEIFCSFVSASDYSIDKIIIEEVARDHERKLADEGMVLRKKQMNLEKRKKKKIAKKERKRLMLLKIDSHRRLGYFFKIAKSYEAKNKIWPYINELFAIRYGDEDAEKKFKQLNTRIATLQDGLDDKGEIEINDEHDEKFISTLARKDADFKDSPAHKILIGYHKEYLLCGTGVRTAAEFMIPLGGGASYISKNCTDTFGKYYHQSSINFSFAYGLGVHAYRDVYKPSKTYSTRDKKNKILAYNGQRLTSCAIVACGIGGQKCRGKSKSNFVIGGALSTHFAENGGTFDMGPRLDFPIPATKNKNYKIMRSIDDYVYSNESHGVLIGSINSFFPKMTIYQVREFKSLLWGGKTPSPLGEHFSICFS